MFPLFEENIDYVDSICSIPCYKHKSGLDVVSFDCPGWNFTLSSDKMSWNITPNSRGRNIIKVMNLFYMKIECTGTDSYILDRSQTENIYYVSIFYLEITKSLSQIKKKIFNSCEKYKMLVKLNYFPNELNYEISKYLIKFILLCIK
jgi:hypothetical protein